MSTTSENFTVLSTVHTAIKDLDILIEKHDDKEKLDDAINAIKNIDRKLFHEELLDEILYKIQDLLVDIYHNINNEILGEIGLDSSNHKSTNKVIYKNNKIEDDDNDGEF